MTASVTYRFSQDPVDQWMDATQHQLQAPHNFLATPPSVHRQEVGTGCGQQSSLALGWKVKTPAADDGFVAMQNQGEGSPQILRGRGEGSPTLPRRQGGGGSPTLSRKQEGSPSLSRRQRNGSPTLSRRQGKGSPAFNALSGGQREYSPALSGRQAEGSPLFRKQGKGSPSFNVLSGRQGESSPALFRRHGEGSPAMARSLGYVSITPSYSRVSDKLRRISSGSLQCSLFCGGQRCKYESAGRWEGKDKAVNGLFSHWVTDTILAMARPSTHVFEEHQLVGQFKSAGICTVINLQLPWEHAKCGPGLERSGFTYQPEYLMKQGVYFYNYGWLDYGVPTLESVLDMVKVVDFALRGGKVAVHCHAGLGRTGVLVACYLVYSRRMGGDEAISHVRTRRPGSIQTRSQIEIVQQFDLFLCPLWNFYPSVSCVESLTAFTFEEYLQNQSLLLHGVEQVNLKYIPKVVYEICLRLKEISKGCPIGTCESCDTQPISLQHVTLHETTNDIEDLGDKCLIHTFLSELENSDSLQTRMKAIQEEMNGSLQWNLLSQETDISILLALLSQYLTALQEPLLTCWDVEDTCSVNDLPLAKCFTVRLILDTVREVFTDSAMKLHGHLLASKLTQLLLQQPRLGGSGDGATPCSQGTVFPLPPPSLPESHVISLILNHWKSS